MNLVAGALTGGLVLTSGAGVVLAQSLDTPPASSCQYSTPYTQEIYKNPTKGSVVGVGFDWNGKSLTYVISYSGGTPTNSFKYQFAGGPLETGTNEVTGIAGPIGTKTLTVTAGGVTYTYPISY
jgi:hypothetical protein